MRNKLVLYIIPSVLLGLLIGLLIPLTPKSNPFKEIRNRQNYKFINPLLECDSDLFTDDKNLNQLKDKLNFIINQQKTTKNISFASVYFRDLNNGPWLGINEKEYFSPASLIKVPMMIAYFKAAESNPSILSKEIENTRPYNPEEQNFAPTNILELNKNYTIEQLIEQMIKYSDNIAYELLLSNIDNSIVYKVYEDLGVDISKAKDDPSGNIITVKDYASFFRILYNSSYLSKEYSEKALNILSKTNFYSGLVAGIPENVQVSHKFGERRYIETNERQLHDCGIVYLSKNPYLLCVMTRGNDFDKLTGLIKQISKTIYENFSQK